MWTYANSSGDPGTAARTVEFIVHDGIRPSNVVTRDVLVIAVNTAPMAAIVPTAYEATEQIPLSLAGTGLSIADPDAGSAPVSVALSVDFGTLNASAGSTGVIVFGSGTGFCNTRRIAAGDQRSAGGCLPGHRSNTSSKAIRRPLPTC